VPVPFERSEPPSVQTTEPAPFAAGWEVTVQLVMLPGSGAPQLAES
jgi:hypothetical protein